MAAIGDVLPVHRTIAMEPPADLRVQRVTQSTQGVFAQAKGVVSGVWDSTVNVVTVAGKKIAFVFALALHWINPWLGDKVHIVSLYIYNIWMSVKGAWREEAVRLEIDGLKNKVQLLTGATEENERLKLQRSQLTERAEELTLRNVELQQQVAAFQQRIDLLSQGSLEKTALARRDLAVAHNEELRGQNRALKAQNWHAKAALAAVAELEQQLASAQARIAGLEGEGRFFKPGVPLVQNMQQSLSQLVRSKETLPPGHSGRIAIENFTRNWTALAALPNQ